MKTFIVITCNGLLFLYMIFSPLHRMENQMQCVQTTYSINYITLLQQRNWWGFVVILALQLKYIPESHVVWLREELYTWMYLSLIACVFSSLMITFYHIVLYINYRMCKYCEINQYWNAYLVLFLLTDIYVREQISSSSKWVLLQPSLCSWLFYLHEDTPSGGSNSRCSS